MESRTRMVSGFQVRVEAGGGEIALSDDLDASTSVFLNVLLAWTRMRSQEATRKKGTRKVKISSQHTYEN